MTKQQYIWEVGAVVCIHFQIIELRVHSKPQKRREFNIWNTAIDGDKIGVFGSSAIYTMRNQIIYTKAQVFVYPIVGSEFKCNKFLWNKINCGISIDSTAYPFECNWWMHSNIECKLLFSNQLIPPPKNKWPGLSIQCPTKLRIKA